MDINTVILIFGHDEISVGRKLRHYMIYDKFFNRFKFYNRFERTSDIINIALALWNTICNSTYALGSRYWTYNPIIAMQNH